MVSGCELLDIVEAAHIWPYRGIEDHHPQNGVLLRADLHTLFDLNLMAIDPGALIVHFHPVALTAGYRSLENAPLKAQTGELPSVTALQLRWQTFSDLLSSLDPRDRPR
jgi:hypothetical protein